LILCLQIANSFRFRLKKTLLCPFPAVTLNILLSMAAIAAGVFSLFFPETKGQAMLESLEQAEIFYKTGKVESTQMEDGLET